MSSVGGIEISEGEIMVGDSDDGEGEHNYGGSRSGWDGNIDQCIINDDDEDNWSRQVETDDLIQRMPSSVTGGETNTIDDEDDGQGSSTIVAEIRDSPGQQQQPVLIPQPRPQPTMKEKLVERERQRRVESERARWKRQFAMAAHAEAEHDEDDNNIGASGDTNARGSNMGYGVVNDNDNSFVTDRNSVAGTVGEDTVAPIETLEEHNNDPNMNYPMERFLQDQHGTEIQVNGDRSDKINNIKNETQGVVMERFLQEQPTAQTAGFVTETRRSSSSSAIPSHLDSIPNGSSVDHIIDNELTLIDLPSDDNTANNIGNELIGGNSFISPSQQPRVVLRLTEAEIQEMAAIDDASRSNAPPSERDDMSELGELVSDFATGLTHIDNQNMSQGTPVTAMESVTSSVGNPISQITVLSGSSSNHNILDDIEGHSLSSNIVVSSAGGDVSLTGNPPSEVTRDDDDDGDGDAMLSPRSSQVPSEILPATTIVDVPPPPFATVPITDTTIATDDPGTELELTATNEIIVNRTIRPGMFNYKEKQQISSIGNLTDTYTPMTAKSPSNKQIPSEFENHIEGFDFDKNNYVSSPRGDIITTRNDLWPSEFSDTTMIPDHGATAAAEEVDQYLETQRVNTGIRTEAIAERNKKKVDDENKPLLGGIPPAVNVTVKNYQSKSSWGSLRSARNMNDLIVIAESIFNDIRSERTATRLSISNEVKDYFGSTILKRAFPERIFSLMITLVLEMPTIFLISGGSGNLCKLIGRTKYTTLVALLPLVSAISGNAGLQASTFTTRGIIHGQIKVDNYRSWLVKEIATAVYLGLGMGFITGTIAFVMGTFSLSFALSIFAAQFIGILAGGFTGTIAPLLFTFIFDRDSDKWNGPLETAVQDVISSFAMIVISYQIMLLFGPYDVSPNDVCFIAD